MTTPHFRRGPLKPLRAKSTRKAESVNERYLERAWTHLLRVADIENRDVFFGSRDLSRSLGMPMPNRNFDESGQPVDLRTHKQGLKVAAILEARGLLVVLQDGVQSPDEAERKPTIWKLMSRVPFPFDLTVSSRHFQDDPSRSDEVPSRSVSVDASNSEDNGTTSPLRDIDTDTETDRDGTSLVHDPLAPKWKWGGRLGPSGLAIARAAENLRPETDTASLLKKSGVPKQTFHRIINRFVEDGLVVRVSKGRWKFSSPKVGLDTYQWDSFSYEVYQFAPERWDEFNQTFELDDTLPHLDSSAQKRWEERMRAK